MSYSFWVFGVLMLFGCFYLYAKVKNTQGLNELEIFELFSEEKYLSNEICETSENLETLN